MKLRDIWAAMVGILIVMGCVSCSSGGGGSDSGSGTNPTSASATTDADVDSIATWYAKARQ